MENDNLRIALCCIERLENKYIREFVEYYKNLGVDHIFMYDTNDENEDHIEDVIGDYINEGYVEKIEWHYHLPRTEVLMAYRDCCSNRLKDYDWCCFFDPDEYLVLKKCKTIKEYISQKCFANFGMIVVNWINMDDNELIYYQPIPLMERFTHIHLDWGDNIPKGAISYTKWGENLHIKSILNCKYTYGKDYEWESPHRPTPIDNNIMKICNSNGEIVTKFKYIWKINKVCYKNAYLKHFRCKTMEEYILNKIPKLNGYGYDQINFDKKFFFHYNNPSRKKCKIFDKLMNKYNNFSNLLI